MGQFLEINETKVKQWDVNKKQCDIKKITKVENNGTKLKTMNNQVNVLIR